jgi:formylglycine-generating enzyme required for sulfatase activity
MRMLIYFLILTVCSTAASQIPAGMEKVPEGTIRMGSKTVKVNGFYMDRCEVTVADFEKFIKATGYRTDAEKNGLSVCYGGDSVKNVTWRCNAEGKIRPGEEYDRPVIHVSYNDASAYAEWAKKRLPTEEEWMLAASGLMKERARINLIAWNVNNSSDDVHPAGTLKANAWNIHDLFGNVYEFVNTTYIQNGEKLVKLKGGCFVDTDRDITTEYFLIYYWSMTTHMAGFRCVINL